MGWIGTCAARIGQPTRVFRAGSQRPRDALADLGSAHRRHLAPARTRLPDRRTLEAGRAQAPLAPLLGLDGHFVERRAEIGSVVSRVRNSRTVRLAIASKCQAYSTQLHRH